MYFQIYHFKETFENMNVWAYFNILHSSLILNICAYIHRVFTTHRNNIYMKQGYMFMSNKPKIFKIRGNYLEIESRGMKWKQKILNIQTDKVS